MASLDPARAGRTVHRRFLSSAATIATLSAITGVILLVREGVTARYFGRSDEIEALMIAMLVPMFLINAAGNSVSAGFVPTLLTVEHEQGRDPARDLVASFLALIVALALAAIVVAALVFPLVLPLIAGSFDAAKLSLTRNLFYLLLPMVLVGALGKFWLALLNGYERFVAGSLIPALFPIAVIASLVIAPADSRLSAYVYGVCAGLVVQLAMALVLAWRAGLARWPRLVPAARPLLRRATGQYLSLLAGTLILMLLEIVEAAFAALQGSGAVAAVNYASKLAVFVLGLAGSALAIAAVPHFARLRAASRGDEIRRFVALGEATTIGGGLVFAAALAYLSEPIVSLIYQRGRFGAGDVEVVAGLNALYVLQAPAFLAGVFYGRLLLVEGRSRVLLTGAVVSVAVAIGANLMLAPWLGASAIPVATALAYLASAIWLRRELFSTLASRYPASTGPERNAGAWP